MMRVLIATDAWHPQVNGVVRTLQSLAESARRLGAAIAFLTPEGFPSAPVPTYPGLRVALPGAREIARRIEEAAPDAIHIATEGPVGMMVRRYCLRRGLPFTTSYATRFPEYIAARFPIPSRLSYAVLRRFHAPASVTLASVSTNCSERCARKMAANDDTIEPQPRNAAHPGWVHTARSECSQSPLMASRSRASKAS
jgi:hypothetical protein